MKILVITSRYTATRDIISENFGRQVRLFGALRRRGHDVTLYCADYRKKEWKDGVLDGLSVKIRPFGLLSGLGFFSGLMDEVSRERYDIIIGTSDPLWGVFGAIASRRSGVPFVFDWHDNYETYAMYALPLFGVFSERAVKSADAVIVVSHALKGYLGRLRKEGVHVIQNGVDVSLFRPLPKGQCRKEYGFLKGEKIIGYTGSIQRRQGIDVLVKAFEELERERGGIRLVIAGRFFGGERRHINLERKNVTYLGGDIRQKEIVRLMNAFDVAVIPNKDDAFTRYCFPYKLVEYMACNVPLVATNVGDVRKFLGDHKECLCMPNDVASMKAALSRQLDVGKAGYRGEVMGNTWDSLAGDMEKVLARVKKARTAKPLK